MFEKPKYTIDYLNGVLQTYAYLNQPPTTLSYHYELTELKSGIEKHNLLTDLFKKFEQQDISIELISLTAFKEDLNKWLFDNLYKLPSDQDRYVNDIFDLLYQALEFREIYKVNGITDHYTFGIEFDYFVLIGATYSYLLSFNYMD